MESDNNQRKRLRLPPIGHLLSTPGVTPSSSEETSADSVPAAKRSRVSRGKNGCLTCRRRKKKCSLCKPICRECERLKLPCAWPSEPDKQTLPSGSEVPPDWYDHPKYGMIRILRGQISYKSEEDVES